MTTRIYSVTPIHVGADERRRRAERYARLAPPGVEVRLDDIGQDAPSSLEHESDVRRSEAEVQAKLDEQAARWDYLLPDCVLDPGVPEPGHPTRLGMLALVAGHLRRAGHRFAAVTRNAAIASELERKVRAYGYAEAFAGVGLLRLDVHSIAEGDRWNEAMRGVLAELSGRGATAVINGCSAVDVASSDATGVLVVDPAETALRLVAGEVGR